MNLFISADKQFYSKYPELNGRKLTNTPEDKHFRQEYMSILKQNKKSDIVGKKYAANSTQKCKHNEEKKNEPEKNKKNCITNTIKIKKEKRNYELLIPGTSIIYKKNNYDELNVYEIISGPCKKPTTVHISTQGLSGPCPEKHKNNAFNIITNDLDIISKSDSELIFKAFAVPFSIDNSFKTYFELIAYLFNNSPTVYNINYTLCGFDKVAILKVYPSLSASASISLNFEWVFSKKGKSLSNDKSPDGGLYEKLKYSFKVKYEGDELIKLEQKNKKPEKKSDQSEIEKFVDVFENSFDYLNKGLSVFLSESQTLKIKFCPNLSGTVSLKEVEGKPFVDNEYSISVGFNPLISMDADADVSGALLNAIPVIGPFLAAIVNSAESVKLADVFLGFKIKGELTVNAVFTKSAGGYLDDPKLAFTGKITIDLVGRVASEHNVWKIQYSVGASVGAHSGVEVDKTELKNNEKGLFVPINLKFLGITLYYQTWKTVGVSEKSNKIPQSANTQSLSGVGQNEQELEKIDENNKAVLVDPFTIYSGNIYVVGGESNGS